MSLALTLGLEYLRIGLLAFGGGMATLPFLFELAEKHAWFTYSEIADMLAISEGTPGPIGINMATFCGYRILGVEGGLIATFSLILPSFIVLYVLSRYAHFSENRIVRSAMKGLKASVAVLLALAFRTLFLITFWHPGRDSLMSFGDSVIDLREVMLFALVLSLSLRFKKVHPVVFTLSCGLATFLLF